MLVTIRQTGKKASKRHILVDGNGIPLSIVLTGANIHDVKKIREVLDSIVIDRPQWIGLPVENLCADKVYFGEPALETIVLRGYNPHVVSRGEDKKEIESSSGKKARRWVVERAFSWLTALDSYLYNKVKPAIQLNL